jgi:signal transduction histidine kinase
MDSVEQTVFEIGLIVSAFALSFLCVNLKRKFSKDSLFSSPLKIFGVAGLVLGATYSADMTLDFFELNIDSLPFFLNFLFIVTLTYGVYSLYSRARIGTIELTKTKEELADAQAKLVKSERLAAVGELAGMVGHDLRNPLAGIKGATYYLRTRCSEGSTETGKNMLKTIDDCIDYSDKIVNDLLDYSRELRLEYAEVTPKSLLNGALGLVKVPKNIQIVDFTQDSPNFKADVGKMNRVYVNMLKNAFDSMPNGGSLKINSEKAQDWVVLSFEDTGTGMTQAVMDKLWTPLFTTKAKGMGFGLPISKRIVEEHGGKISAESNVGKGTTFTVTIPLEPKPIG